MTLKLVFPVLVLLVLVLDPAPGRASALSCYVRATGVAFGEFSGAEKRARGDLTLACTGTGAVGYTILISTGASGTYSPRTLASSDAVLPYNLYTNAAYAVIWGDGSRGTGSVSGVLEPRGASGASISLPVYGRLPAWTRPTPGAYSGTLVVTIVY